MFPKKNTLDRLTGSITKHLSLKNIHHYRHWEKTGKRACTFDFGIDCYFQFLITISISIFQLKKSSIFFMLFCMFFLVSFYILKSTIIIYFKIFRNNFFAFVFFLYSYTLKKYIERLFGCFYYISNYFLITFRFILILELYFLMRTVGHHTCGIVWVDGSMVIVLAEKCILLHFLWGTDEALVKFQ